MKMLMHLTDWKNHVYKCDELSKIGSFYCEFSICFGYFKSDKKSKVIKRVFPFECLILLHCTLYESYDMSYACALCLCLMLVPQPCVCDAIFSSIQWKCFKLIKCYY